MSHHRSTFFIFLALFANLLSASAATHMYDQLVPQMLTTVNIEEPSEQELLLINACRAHSEGGLKYPVVGTENWQAINSIDMFKLILPAYARNITASGYIALARQAAQMTDKKATLENRVALTQYLTSHTEVAAKLTKILNHGQVSEKYFFNLFKQLTEEEQEELDKANQKLYFSWFDKYNESSTALEVGPRLNQLTTANLYTIPMLLYSFYHFIGCKVSKVEKLMKEGFECKTYTESNKKRKEIEDTIFKDVTFVRWATESYNKKKTELKAKKASELSNDEIIIMTSDFITDLPDRLRALFLSSTQAVAAITYDGARNLPSATLSLGKFIAKNAMWQNPIRDYIKEETPNLDEDLVNGSARILNWTAGISLTVYGALLYSRYKSTKTLLDLIYEKQQDLISAGQLVKSMQMVHKVIGSDATLQKLMSNEHAKLGELFDANSKKTSDDLKKLINALMSSSFQGSSSYFFSQQGKILATHHLLNRIKAQLIPYLEAFGQVDAYLATAKLYQEFANHPRVHFCLPEFIDASSPVMDAQEYWHPMINANKVVTNTLSMNNKTAANLIITGPNAGGKTTSLMSLIINIIFAQSWGIAPSSSLRLTPFAKIHSYLDITTNLQEGLSLFAAEVDRAKKLKISIMSCNPGQKTFTIIDEIFSGTDPKVASDVGFTFAAQLGELAHSMTIITTHFPALTELQAKDKHYVNYKVADATIHEDGTITYPFKLVPGISSQNIAAQMLHNQGII